MESLGAISKKGWIIIGVVLLLLVIASYSMGKVSGIEKCKNN